MMVFFRERWRRSPVGMRYMVMIYVVGGLAAIANAFLLRPVPRHQDIILLLGVMDLAVAPSLLLPPWSRWPAMTMSWLLIPSLLLIQGFAAAGALTPGTYATFFIVIFVWIGISQAPSTSYVVAPLAAIGYLMPLLTNAPVGPVWHSVGLVIPVGVLISELISRNQLSASRAERRASELEKERAIASVEVAVRTELMEQLHFQASLLDEAPASMIVTDTDGTVRYWNSQAERFFGYSRHEALGRHINDLTVFPRDKGLANEIMNAIAGGERWSGEWNAPTSGGSELWIWTTLTGLKDDEGNITGILGTAIDISERKAAEEKVQESERRFETLIENASDGFVVVDEQGSITYASPVATRLLGWERDELVGRDALEWVHPHDRVSTETILQSVVENGGSIGPQILRASHRDGTWRTLEGTITSLLDHPERGMVINFHDVTARVAAAEALEESRNTLALMLEQLPAVLWTTDHSLCLTSLQGKGLDALGLAWDPSQRVMISEMAVQTEVQDDVMAAHQRALAGRDASYEMAGFGRNQRCQVRPLMKGREVVGVIGIALDVTEELLLEQEMRQAQKLEAVGALAGGVAHDFNNLLAVILNYAQFIQEDTKDDSIKGDLEEIIAAAQSAARLTRQLLTFSRKDRPEIEYVDVGASIKTIEKMIKRVLIESIDLRVEAADDLHCVEMDPSHLEQIILNLAVNARDAMPAGGILRIAAHNLPQGGKGPDLLRLLVTDTGSGIPPEVKERIFDPFFTTKGPGEGTGLGLATVYGIVTHMGGHIAVESVVGDGTTFTIDLPTSIHGSQEDCIDSGLAATSCGADVLVVEDEAKLRRVLKRILESAGCKVALAANGAEALSCLSEPDQRFDLLITDVVMPGMSGREISTISGLDTLFISGYPDPVISEHGLKVAGAHFLRKPFTSTDLMAKVSEIVSDSMAGNAPTSNATKPTEAA